MREVVGHFVDGKGIPYEVEDTLFDAFEEDDYGGALHLSTVHIDDGKQTPIGLVFWREMPEEEMREWIDYAELVELARRRRHLQSIAADDSDGSNKPLLLNNNVDESKDSITSRDGVEIVGGDVSKQTVQQRKQEDFPTSDKLRRSLAMVQSESLKWLGQLEREEQRNQSSVVTPDDIPRDYAQAWAKIELLAVRPPWWGQKIGTLLLACAMYHAWLHNDKRCVLHVAGGTSNVPAVRLYHRFGFVPVPSGLFRKPDKDVYVLGNIDLALKSLLWSETLGLPEKGDIHSLAN
jgi:GNAT superfamily N-acetyltransferase